MADVGAHQRKLELILNEIAADQTVFRVTLQCFLLNMLQTRSDRAPEALAELKQQVLDTIARTLPSQDDPQGGERRKRLTEMRGALFFQELEDVVGRVAVSPGRTGAH